MTTSTQPVMAPSEQRWVEDLFLHGHLLGRWITDYVDLEESLAVGSIAQESMAHASALLEAHGYDEAARDQVVYLRSPAEWYPARVLSTPNDNWASVVVRGYLLAMASELRIAGLRSEGTYEALADVLQAEQELHRVHWRRWLEVLSVSPEARGELLTAMQVGLALSGDVLSEQETPDGMVKEQYQRWSDVVHTDLDALGLGGQKVAECVPRTQAADLQEVVAALAALTQLRADPQDRVKGLYR